MEDFQISFKADIKTEEENVVDDESKEDIDDEVRWNEPSHINEMRRFIRVIVTSEDEATIFIILWDPNLPEYRINNLSDKEITVYQEGTKEWRVIRTLRPAKVIEKHNGDKIYNSIPIPFVWDDQTLETKRIVLKSGNDRMKYDFDEIGKK